MTDTRLITTEQVAYLAGVKTSSIRQYRVRGTMPEPWEYVGVTPVWRICDIVKWCQTRPNVGRPVKGK